MFKLIVNRRLFIKKLAVGAGVSCLSANSAFSKEEKTKRVKVETLKEENCLVIDGWVLPSGDIQPKSRSTKNNV